jgi:hypothetical protein
VEKSEEFRRKIESWAGLALVAEQVRDDLEAVCGVLKTEALALQARQTCL